MRRYRSYATGVYAAVVLGIGGYASSVDASSGATAATQKSQEASKEETTVENTTVVKSVAGAIESMEESQAGAFRSIHIYEPVTKIENGRLSIDSQSDMSSSGKIILNVSSDATYILDAVTGFFIRAKGIKDGETIYAYVGPTMTMSLPPMTNAEVVFVNIPADAKVPDFVEVKSMITDAATSESILTAVGGTKYTLASDCNIFSYLTRSIVTLDDLTRGRKCVVWSDDDNVAVKVMAFAEQIQI